MVNYSHALALPAAGRGAVRRHPSSHRVGQPSARPAGGGAGVDAHRFAPGRAGRLPRPVRQAAARERLRVRARRRRAAGAGAGPGQRPGGGRGGARPGQQARRPAPRREGHSGRSWRSSTCRSSAGVPRPRRWDESLAAIKDGEADYDSILAEHKQRQAALDAYEKSVPARMPAWEASFARRPEWAPTGFVRGATRGGATLAWKADGSLLASGPVLPQELYTLVIESDLPRITGLRLELLTDPSLGAMGPGRADNGNFVLNELRVSAIEKGKKGKPGAVGPGQRPGDLLAGRLRGGQGHRQQPRARAGPSARRRASRKRPCSSSRSR